MGKEKTYKVTGVSHYLDNLLTLKTENFDYDLSKKDNIRTCQPHPGD